MTTNTTNSPLSVIEDSKKQLTEALTNVTPDDFLISGILNFVRSKFLSLIIKDINDSIRKSSPGLDESELQLAQNDSKQADETAESLIDRVWSDFYHPVFKYYQSQFQDLRNQELHLNRKRSVEIRKLNDKFRKLSKLSSDFYLDLLKHILTQHKVSFIIPEAFYQFLKLTVQPNAIQINKSDNATVVKLVYIVHRSLLFLGSTSRYRSTFSRFLAKTEHEDFNHALEYCHYSELLLPAFGEAHNHIGMVYNAQGDTFLAAYEFLRSALARIPSKLGTQNFQVCLHSTSKVIDDLNRLRLENNINNKNRDKCLSVYFMVLFGFHFNPSRWKRSETTFINGTPVKDVKADLYKIITEIASKGNDVFQIQKLLIMLIGGIALSGNAKDSTLTPELTSHLKFTFEFVDIISKFFIEQWNVDKSKCLNLLPFFRLLLSWLRSNKIVLQYAHRDTNFLKNTALLLNILFKYVYDGDFSHRPKRDQYFLEDVGLKEFTPIDRLLWDFDDGHIFEDLDAPTKLIGQFKSHDVKEENRLRMLAIGCLGKKIISANRVGIKYDADKKVFDVSELKEIRKPKIPGDLPKKNQDPIIDKEIHATKKNRRRRRGGKGKKNEEDTTPQKPNSAKQVIPSSSSSDSSDALVEVSQNSYNRKTNHGLNAGIQQLSVSQNTANSHQAVLSIEELELKLTNSKKDQNYASMVDSLVDEVSIENQVPKSNTATPQNEKTQWESTPPYNPNPHTQVQASSQYNSFGFSPNFNNSGYNTSPFMNQSPFPAYQNYYPMYQPQQGAPQVQQQQSQSQPASNMYRQYQELYQQYQTPPPPQQQQFQPQQQPQSSFNMYSYGYPQYAYPPTTQVPETPSQHQQNGGQSTGNYQS